MTNLYLLTGSEANIQRTIHMKRMASPSCDRTPPDTTSPHSILTNNTSNNIGGDNEYNCCHSSIGPNLKRRKQLFDQLYIFGAPPDSTAFQNGPTLLVTYPSTSHHYTQTSEHLDQLKRFCFPSGFHKIHSGGSKLSRRSSYSSSTLDLFACDLDSTRKRFNKSRKFKNKDNYNNSNDNKGKNNTSDFDNDIDSNNTNASTNTNTNDDDNAIDSDNNNFDSILNEFVFYLTDDQNQKSYGICVQFEVSNRNSPTNPFFSSHFSRNYPFCLCLISRFPYLLAHFEFGVYLVLMLLGLEKPARQSSNQPRIPLAIRGFCHSSLVLDRAFPAVAVMKGFNAPRAFFEEVTFYHRMSAKKKKAMDNLMNAEAYRRNNNDINNGNNNNFNNNNNNFNFNNNNYSFNDNKDNNNNDRNINSSTGENDDSYIEDKKDRNGNDDLKVCATNKNSSDIVLTKGKYSSSSKGYITENKRNSPISDSSSNGVNKNTNNIRTNTKIARTSSASHINIDSINNTSNLKAKDRKSAPASLSSPSAVRSTNISSLSPSSFSHNSNHPSELAPISLSSRIQLGVPFHLTKSQCNAYPTLHFLFSALTPSLIVNIYTFLLLEQRVLFVSRDPQLASFSAIASTSLLSPFKTQASVLPIVPSDDTFQELLQLPTPYIAGSTLANDNADVIVNLDEGSISHPPNLPQLPGHDDLVRRIDFLLKDSEYSILVPPKELKSFFGVISDNPEYEKFISLNEKNPFVFSKALLTKNSTKIKYVLTPYIIEDIMTLFSGCIAPYLTEKIKGCFVTDTTDPLSPVTVLNSDLLIYLTPENEREFYTAFKSTQIFVDFCEKETDKHSLSLLQPQPQTHSNRINKSRSLPNL